MAMTYAQQLEEVQAAISKVMSGQSYEIAGRRLQRADLAALTAREKYLRVMAAREANGGIRLRGATPT